MDIDVRKEDRMLEREPSRWKCASCGHVNRALRHKCTGCEKQRWEVLGFREQDAKEMCRRVYSIHREPESKLAVIA